MEEFIKKCYWCDEVIKEPKVNETLCPTCLEDYEHYEEYGWGT